MRRIILLVLLLPALAISQEVVTRVIDVGPGHASITKMPGPHYMIFDAGLKGTSDHIVTQIKELMDGDEVIDLMVLSHTDSDHVGAVPAILDAFDVKVILRAGLFRCDANDDCAWRLAQNKIRERVEQGITIDLNLRRSPIGHGYTFEFGETTVQLISGFHRPPSAWGLSDTSAEFRNAGSIVVRLEYDGKSILFTGDEFGKDPGLNSPMEAAEEFMVDNQANRPIQSDVLIAAHHGADNGSSTDFLKAVSPTFVIFPAGGYDQSAIELRHDVLVYTSEVLLEGIEVTGALEVVLSVSSSATDTDFTAKLVDVYPDGRAFNVQEGALRMRHRESLSSSTLMQPGDIYEARLDLHATSNYFGPGHRIRLEVSS